VSASDYPEDFRNWPLDRRKAFFAEATSRARERQKASGADHSGESEGAIITATPFVWTDPAKIPPRRWVYGRHYQRQHISLTVALPGVGKSNLVIVEHLAIVTGRALLGVEPAERTKTWYWNGEDPQDELRRRFAAAVLHYGIDPKEIEGRLFVDSGRSTKIIVATQTKTGAVIARPVVDQVIATIRQRNIGVMTVDPFIACHSVTENDNTSMQAVVTAWAEIADVTGCSIDLVHHSRKTGGGDVSIEDSRGASTSIAKTRSGRSLNVMTKDEGEKSGVKERRAHFRVDSGEKSNNSPPSNTVDWYELRSFALVNGDNVGVVSKWKWPDPLKGATVVDLRNAQAAVASSHWRASPQAKDWVGVAIAGALKLDLTIKADRTKVSHLLKMWIRSGMFRIVKGQDRKRNLRSFIEVGERAND
jgi:AAA domain